MVGVGHHGRHHARILAGLPGARLVAVCDADTARLDEACRATGARGASRLSELPADLDAACVAVPAAGHHAAACFFLSRGIPVLLEKPATGSLALAADLARTARRAGTFFFPGFIERFNPAFAHFRGRAGRLARAEAVRESPFPFRSLDLDVVMDVMIHDLDLILSLFPSPVASVEASGLRVLSGSADVARAALRFADGSSATLAASRVEPETLRRALFFEADRRWRVDYRERTVTETRTVRALPRGGVPAAHRSMDRFFRSRARRPAGPEPLRAELQAFLARVAGARDPAHPTMESTLRVLSVAERIARRIRTRGAKR